MNSMSGELHGVKWTVDDSVVETLQDKGIDAVAEIQQAIETYASIINQQTENT